MPNWALVLFASASPGGPGAQHRLSYARPVITEAEMKSFLPALAVAAIGACAAAHAEEIGEVDTVFKLIGPDHKIVVDAYDDPGVAGVTCYVSRAKTGGMGGRVRTSPKPRSPAARPAPSPSPAAPAEEMFSERISLVFKMLRVVRMVDKAPATLVPDVLRPRHRGSPQNSVTAVPVDRATPIPLR